MSYQIIECSPKAKAKITSYSDAVGTSTNPHYLTKYPFDDLKIGQAFTIPFETAIESSLRLTSTNRGKRDKKKFCVLKHSDLNLFEVARIG